MACWQAAVGGALAIPVRSAAAAGELRLLQGPAWERVPLPRSAGVLHESPAAPGAQLQSQTLAWPASHGSLSASCTGKNAAKQGRAEQTCQRNSHSTSSPKAGTDFGASTNHTCKLRPCLSLSCQGLTGGVELHTPEQLLHHCHHRVHSGCSLGLHSKSSQQELLSLSAVRLMQHMCNGKRADLGTGLPTLACSQLSRALLGMLPLYSTQKPLQDPANLALELVLAASPAWSSTPCVSRLRCGAHHVIGNRHVCAVLV